MAKNRTAYEEQKIKLAMMQISEYARQWRITESNFPTQKSIAAVMQVRPSSVTSFELGYSTSLSFVLDYAMLGMPLEPVLDIWKGVRKNVPADKLL